MAGGSRASPHRATRTTRGPRPGSARAPPTAATPTAGPAATGSRLSLAAEGEAYGVPLSFGDDGEKLYFFLIRFGDDSLKLDFAETTARASFTTYSFVDKHHWRSVVVRGQIQRVPERDLDAADEALFDNAEFASLFPYSEPMTERPRYRLTVESVTGQQGQGHEA